MKLGNSRISHQRARIQNSDQVIEKLMNMVDLFKSLGY